MKEGEAKSNDYAIIAIVILIATGFWFFEVLTRHFVFSENIPIALIPDDWKRNMDAFAHNVNDRWLQHIC